MRCFQCVFLGAFFFLQSAEAAQPAFPRGNCFSQRQVFRLLAWCQSNLEFPRPKRYICLGNDQMLYGVTPAEHNREARTRLEGKPFSPTLLSCAEYCGGSEYLDGTVANFAYHYPELRDRVDSLIYCKCRGVGSDPAFVPPTPPSLRKEALRNRDWTTLAEVDRECSSRPSQYSLAQYNDLLLGKRCNDFRPGSRMSCPDGHIDHCSVHPNPEGINALPWNHRCERFPDH